MIQNLSCNRVVFHDLTVDFTGLEEMSSGGFEGSLFYLCSPSPRYCHWLERTCPWDEQISAYAFQRCYHGGKTQKGVAQSAEAGTITEDLCCMNLVGQSDAG